MEQRLGQSTDESAHEDDFEVIIPTPDDWQLYRDLRIRSLFEEPIAFLDVEEGLARWTSRSEEEWREILSGPRGDGGETMVFLAQGNGGAIGMVQAVLPPLREGKRVAEIQHMYVERKNRGMGYGKKLLTGLLGKLSERGDVDEAMLTVVNTQKEAMKMYQDIGFVSISITTDAARRGTETYDEVTMVLPLNL